MSSLRKMTFLLAVTSVLVPGVGCMAEAEEGSQGDEERVESTGEAAQACGAGFGGWGGGPFWGGGLWGGGPWGGGPWGGGPWGGGPWVGAFDVGFPGAFAVPAALAWGPRARPWL